jgi:glycosyltransferase 2 family protein
LLAGILFGILVMAFVALAGDVRQVGRQVLGFRWSLFPIVLLLTLFNYGLRFIKWHYYLRLVGVRNLPVKESGRMFVGGFPLAVTPGKVGEALKGVWLKDATGIAVAIGVSVVVAERISDGLAVMALSSLGVVAYPQYWPAFAIILAALLGVVIVSQIRPLAYWLLDTGERIPVVKRFAHSLRLFYEGSFTLFRPKALLIAVGLGTISWLGEGLGFFVILTGLGVPASLHTAAMAVFVLSFSIVIGAASTLPAGLGVSEASIAAMLALLLGLEADVSAAATLLIRFATLWFGVGLGLMVWAFSRKMLGISSAGQKTGRGPNMVEEERGTQHATR